MNDHLSEYRFARYVAGASTSSERRHVRECARCSAELDRFAAAVSAFRSAVRCRIDAHVAGEHAPVAVPAKERATGGVLQWSMGLITAAALTFFFFLPVPSDETWRVETIETGANASADDFMHSINVHLSRTVPEAMEPILVLFPERNGTDDFGGLQ